MSATLPKRVDAERMVAARRAFHGSMPVAAMRRLADAIADDRGEVQYELEFGRDPLGTAYLGVRAWARLNLECQRTLEVFEHPLKVDVRLGLIEHEHDESGLPPGYEPLLLEEGGLEPERVIEDELLLALPEFPVRPGSEAVADSGGTVQQDAPAREDNPFAVLRELKKHKQ